MKYLKSFSEAKKEKEEKEQEMGFDAEKLVSDEEPSIKTETEVIKDSDVKKIKDTIVKPEITYPKKK